MSKDKISIAIPVLNEEKNIGRCLSKIFKQDYPKDKLEVFIVDAGSSDKTLEIAKKFNVKILDNSKEKDYDTGKMLALKKATGKFFMYLDADMFLDSDNWFKLMIKPFENENISGTFTKFIVVENDNSLNRYMSYDELQRDPLYKFLTPPIKDIIIEKKKGFYVCKMRLNNPPPIGLCLYKTKLLKKYFSGNRFQDLEVPLKLLIEGYGYFAYVPKAGVHHLHVRNLKQLLKKRVRNVDISGEGTKGYLPDYEKRLFKWIDMNDKSNVLKLILWTLYVNLFIPLLISGSYKSLKYKDICFMLEPIVGMAVTDAVLFAFVKNDRGRKFILGIKK